MPKKKRTPAQLKADQAKRVHAKGCNGYMRMKWSGRACRCGARWECL